MSGPLVLSLFPGIGLLDMAFELEGFCVVRGPDLLWGGDVRTFHPPACVFVGVVGGPPCQAFGGLANFRHRWKHQPENLIPEFERVVDEAKPSWFVMENVPTAPEPFVAGYVTRQHVLNNRWLGEAQQRVRRFSFGTNWYIDNPPRLRFELAALEAVEWQQTVTSANGGERRVHGKKATGGAISRYTVAEARRLQGVAPDFLDDRCPLTEKGKLKVLAQGVPLPMGRAVAKAIKRAMGYDTQECAS